MSSQEKTKQERPSGKTLGLGCAILCIFVAIETLLIIAVFTTAFIAWQHHSGTMLKSCMAFVIVTIVFPLHIHYVFEGPIFEDYEDASFNQLH